MTILALDTSLGALSVAVATGEPVRIVGRLERREKGHAEALFPMIEAVLASAGIGLKLFGSLRSPDRNSRNWVRR